jgi:hypothetical protein
LESFLAAGLDGSDAGAAAGVVPVVSDFFGSEGESFFADCL